MNKIENDTLQRQNYAAPKLTVLDAGKTATGTFPSPTEGPVSNLTS